MERTTALNILGLKDPITEDQVKQAYRTRVKSAHPDKGGRQLQFMNVKSAYDYLRVNIVEPKATYRMPTAEEIKEYLRKERMRNEKERKDRIVAGKIVLIAIVLIVLVSGLYGIIAHHYLDHLKGTDPDVMYWGITATNLYVSYLLLKNFGSIMNGLCSLYAWYIVKFKSHEKKS